MIQYFIDTEECKRVKHSMHQRAVNRNAKHHMDDIYTGPLKKVISLRNISKVFSHFYNT